MRPVRTTRKHVTLALLILATQTLSWSEASAKAKAKEKKKKPVAVAAARSKSVVSNFDPFLFRTSRVQKVLSDLKSRPVQQTAQIDTTVIESSPAKSHLLEALYARQMVESSWATEMLSDKLVLFGVLERELGSKVTVYLPRTIGLVEFLNKYRLIKSNGEIASDGDRIEAALFEEFPAGFFVRPSVGVSTQERGKGLYPDTDQFVMALLNPQAGLYNSRQYRKPVVSEILGSVASGEAFVLQENVIAAADAHRSLKTKFFHEVRIHTYEGRVVEGAVPERWVQTNVLSKEQVAKAESFVADFLRSLPLNLMSRQAWGVDVAVMDNGDMRIIDVVTNRGKQIQWSSYLEQPRVLGAYARHLETFYGWKFDGFSGTLIRNNFANYFPYWEKRIAMAKPGLGKVMAYLPPLP